MCCDFPYAGGDSVNVSVCLPASLPPCLSVSPPASLPPCLSVSQPACLSVTLEKDIQAPTKVFETFENHPARPPMVMPR